MTDPTADSTNPDGSPIAPGPEPTTSTSANPPTAPTDAIFIDTGGNPQTTTVDPTYSIDEAALKVAKGDTHIWANELADMIGHTTGTWIAPDTFVPWFATFADQVGAIEGRSIIFDIANTPISATLDGDAGTLLLDLRNDLAFKVRKRYGLT